MAWRRLLALLTSGLTMFSAYDALAGTKGACWMGPATGWSIQASLGYSASSFESVFNSSLPQESVIVAGGDICVNATGNAVVGQGDLSVVGSGGTTLCVDGRPSGAPRDILSGFLAPDEKESYGRPVGVTIGPDGASLLVADDVGDVIWRVTGARAG